MNHQDLKDKLRRHYFELQKEKLANDPYYKNLRDMTFKIMNHSARPMIALKGGEIQWEIPKEVALINEQITDYINGYYPILNAEKQARMIREIDYSVVVMPKTLTFDKIDARLTLFKTYLKYRLNCLFDSHGWVYDSPLEYDEWLYMKGYEGLTEIIWN